MNKYSRLDEINRQKQPVSAAPKLPEYYLDAWARLRWQGEQAGQAVIHWTKNSLSWKVKARELLHGQTLCVDAQIKNNDNLFASRGTLVGPSSLP